jgi:hypothetical protein
VTSSLKEDEEFDDFLIGLVIVEIGGELCTPQVNSGVMSDYGKRN